ASKCNPVLGRREFLDEMRDGLVGPEFRIGLDQREQFAERTGKRRFGHLDGGERLAVAGPLVGGGMRGHRLLARPHHGLERLALMGEVRPCRRDEIGYEVVPTLELHVVPRERVVEAVARSDELVVLDDGPYEHGREQYSENRKTVHRVHSSTPPELPE